MYVCTILSSYLFTAAAAHHSLESMYVPSNFHTLMTGSQIFEIVASDESQ